MTPLEKTPLDDESAGTDMLDLTILAARHLRTLIFVPLLAGTIALGISFAVTPTFTAKALIIPPHQQQSSATMALQGLGALAGAAGAAAGIRSPADQYVALMRSATVEERLVDRFGLVQVYRAKFHDDARRTLRENTRIGASRKDGLIAIEVDDESPERAAAVANAYFEELELLTNRLAVTEAQQRRQFFERQLQQTKQRFTQAQRQLQATGFSEGALRAEPRAAADGYARLRAEVTAAEVRLQAMRGYLAESAAEYQRARSQLAALRDQLARLESSNAGASDDDYVSRYREFKYQENLYELFVRQFELAKLDESREGALIQVVDVAKPPERKSKPKRAAIAIVTTMATAVLTLLWIIGLGALDRARADSKSAAKVLSLQSALRSALWNRGNRPS